MSLLRILVLATRMVCTPANTRSGFLLLLMLFHRIVIAPDLIGLRGASNEVEGRARRRQMSALATRRPRHSKTR
jgi:hypothetical protein